jgi:uncharacterized protein YlxP (DUF503 family)
MSIGALKVRLRLPENDSLKGKRRVLKSIVTQVRNKFNVSIAEIEDQDLWQLATLGIVCVSTDRRHADQILAKVAEFISSIRGDAEILDYEIEFLNAL